MFKIKRLISIFLIAFFLTFQVANTKNAYAVSASGYLADLNTVYPAALTAIAPYAPQIALIGIAAISAGIIFENRKELAVFSYDVYTRMKNSGKEFAQDLEGVWQITTSNIEEFLNILTSQKTDTFSSGSFEYAIDTVYFELTKPTGVISSRYVSPYADGFFSYDFGIRTVNGESRYMIRFYRTDGSFYDEGVETAKYFTNIKVKYLDFYGGAREIYNEPKSVDFPDAFYPDTIPTVSDGLAIPESITIPLDLPIDTVLDGLVGVDSVATAADVLGIESAVPIEENPPIDDNPPIENTMPTDWSVPTDVALDFSPLLFDLKSKFPFSIPWDLKNSISALSVTPQAPKWVIPFDAFGADADLEINFSQFQKLADIVRWGILISFSFGLIILTRKIIGG